MLNWPREGPEKTNWWCLQWCRLKFGLLCCVLSGALGAAGCATDAERCRELRESSRGAVNRLSRGCVTNEECAPIALVCGERAALRRDQDVRAVSVALERFEATCACEGVPQDGGVPDGGAPDGGVLMGTAICVSNVCRIAAENELPACDSARAAVVAAIDAENRCVLDADCTALNVQSCPPICAQPTALAGSRVGIDAAIAGLDAVPGCRACGQSCGAARPVQCAAGRCATTGTGDSCDALDGEIVRILSMPGFCRGYADCRYVRFPRTRQGLCGAATTEGDATRLGAALAPWSRACCQSCADCPEPAAGFARCVSNRCIGADQCATRLEGTAWRLGFTFQSSDGTQRSLLVDGRGLTSLTPPAVTGRATDAELAAIVGAANTASLFCLDSSFHAVGAENLRLTVTATPAMELRELVYSDADVRPSGFAELERLLRAIAARLLGGP